MLTDEREDYVFRVIDPAVAPGMRSAPRRSLIAIKGIMAGGILRVDYCDCSAGVSALRFNVNAYNLAPC